MPRALLSCEPIFSVAHEHATSMDFLHANTSNVPGALKGIELRVASRREPHPSQHLRRTAGRCALPPGNRDGARRATGARGPSGVRLGHRGDVRAWQGRCSTAWACPFTPRSLSDCEPSYLRAGSVARELAGPPHLPENAGMMVALAGSELRGRSRHLQAGRLAELRRVVTSTESSARLARERRGMHRTNRHPDHNHVADHILGGRLASWQETSPRHRTRPVYARLFLAFLASSPRFSFTLSFTIWRIKPS